MSTRLNTGGRLIDTDCAMRFTFNGKVLKGYAGDTLASALLANDQMLVGRSFKYHRPRGIVASGVEEPNALVNLGVEGRFEPNQRATTTELFDGLLATSQNHWPSLEFDVGALNARLARFMPAGFYYKMFIHPRPLWKYVYEPFIRQAAGLGQAPKGRDADRYEHFYAFCDVLVVGAGIAGLMAAKTAAATGAKVLVLEQNAHAGGRAPVDGGTVDGQPVDKVVDQLVADLSDMPNVTLRLRTMGAGVYDHGYVLGYERLTDHAPDAPGPRHRLWRIRAGHVVTATGAIERPLSFAGNDVPGVMLASAVRDYIVNYAVSPGDRVAVVTNNDDAYRTAIAVKKAGLDVPVILDARVLPEDSPLVAEATRLGVRVIMGHGVAKVLGGKR
ncbi:MAG: 2Fe-2S iron-sulfur cluster-binding protein, partial [Pseudomonadota bacterium]